MPTAACENRSRTSSTPRPGPLKLGRARIEEAARQVGRQVRHKVQEARQADTEAAQLKEMGERKRVTDEAQRLQRYGD